MGERSCEFSRLAVVSVLLFFPVLVEFENPWKETLASRLGAIAGFLRLCFTSDRLRWLQIPGIKIPASHVDISGAVLGLNPELWGEQWAVSGLWAPAPWRSGSGCDAPMLCICWDNLPHGLAALHWKCLRAGGPAPRNRVFFGGITTTLMSFLAGNFVRTLGPDERSGTAGIG